MADKIIDGLQVEPQQLITDGTYSAYFRDLIRMAAGGGSIQLPLSYKTDIVEKPTLNGVEIDGDKTAADYNITVPAPIIDHNNLTNRSDPGQHPAEAVSYGLGSVKTALDSTALSISTLSSEVAGKVDNTYVENYAYSKQDVAALVESVKGSTFSFVGVIQSTTPATPSDNLLWYNISISGKPIAPFPWAIKQWDGTQWVDLSYTADNFDLWANRNDNGGYYWFVDHWNRIDTETVTVDLSEYRKALDQDAITATLATKADLQAYSTTLAINALLAGKADSIHNHTSADVTDWAAKLALYAPIASPSFTGTPLAPTAATATNSTQLATTAYVKNQAYATLASPSFTGTPLAPTVADASNNTSIATTAWTRKLLASGVASAGMSVPDMASMETTNRISTATGSWTADRAGYVQCGLTATTPSAYSGTFACLYITKNSAYVFKELAMGTASGQKLDQITLVEVAVGDVVTFANSLSSTLTSVTHTCYYVPPKWVNTVPSVVVQDPIKTYSYSEQDSGKTWVDGKKIYIKTVDCGKLPAASSSKTVAHSIASFAALIDLYGVANYNGNYLPIPGPAISTSTIQTYSTATSIYILSGADTNLPNYSAYITLLYTCTNR